MRSQDLTGEFFQLGRRLNRAAPTRSVFFYEKIHSMGGGPLLLIGVWLILGLLLACLSYVSV